MTSVKVLTPSGRGAVAVLRVSGEVRRIDDPVPLFRTAKGQLISDLPIGRVTFGTWGTSPAEEVVVSRMGDAEVEICCHGGRAAAARVLADLHSRGCETFDKALSQQSEQELVDSECLAALSRATTLRTADILLQQHSGLLRQAFEQCQQADDENAIRQVDELLRWAVFGVHLTQPWRVVLCGRPNVGKSSLINAIVGYTRSIVFDQPGTTRDVVTAETAIDGWPVALSDTAGLREDSDELETAGIERARRHIAEADLRIMLLDTSLAPMPDDRKLLATWTDALVVAHKSDLPCVWGARLPAGALSVSSLTGVGVDRLAEEIVRRLVPEVPAPMTPVPISSRQVSSLHAMRRLMDPGGLIGA